MTDLKIYPVTTEAVLAYLGIDYVDPMVNANIERMIRTADAYLIGALGDTYPREDPRSTDLALMVIGDLYDVRGIKDSMSNNARKLFDDMALQIRLELRREKHDEN